MNRIIVESVVESTVESIEPCILGLFLMNQVAALIFPLAASKQLRRALTIRYRDSSVDSNIPGTSLDQGVSSHFKILSAEIEIEPT